MTVLQVSGLPTNQAFLKRLASHPAFIAAELDTSFIQKHHASLLSPEPVPSHVVALAAIADHLLQVQEVRSGICTPYVCMIVCEYVAATCCDTSCNC